jgi:hypothetical protein
MKNWKTTLTGFSVLLSMSLYWLSIISTEQFVTGTAFLVSVGLIAAKDASKKAE